MAARYYPPAYAHAGPSPMMMPPPKPALMPITQHEAVLAREHRRFQDMHTELSAEIRRLEKDLNAKLKELKEKHQAETVALNTEIKLLKEELQKERQGRKNAATFINSKRRGSAGLKRRAASSSTGNEATRRTTSTNKRAKRTETQSTASNGEAKQTQSSSNNLREESWNYKYNLLVAFKEENGHCNVPKSDTGLFGWITQQRTLYRKMLEGKQNSLTVERVEKLTGLGLRLHVKPKKPAKPKKPQQTQKWNDRYQQLQRYKEQHGDLQVSKLDHPQLWTWIGDQRTHHRFLREGKPTSMTPERIQRLNALGFQWTVNKNPPTSWEERISQLKEFKEKHGHCNVPQKCRDCAPGLGNFVLEQRRAFKILMNGGKPARCLTKERMDELDALGFEWFVRNRGGKYDMTSRNS